MIKVDTNRMEDAHARLCGIRNRIAEIEDEVAHARALLRSCMEDGGAVTDVMMFSLNVQAKSIGKRTETVEQLARILSSVTEQYRKCETDAKNKTVRASLLNIWGIGEIKPIIMLGNPPVHPFYFPEDLIAQTINQYIGPLITVGEDTV